MFANALCNLTGKLARADTKGTYQSEPIGGGGARARASLPSDEVSVSEARQRRRLLIKPAPTGRLLRGAQCSIVSLWTKAGRFNAPSEPQRGGEIYTADWRRPGKRAASAILAIGGAGGHKYAANWRRTGAELASDICGRKADGRGTFIMKAGRLAHFAQTQTDVSARAARRKLFAAASSDALMLSCLVWARRATEAAVCSAPQLKQQHYNISPT